MTNPHTVIKAIEDCGEHMGKAHTLAYALGMMTELHDQQGLPDDDSMRLENSPELMGDITSHIWSGYLLPATLDEMRAEVKTQLNEWRTIALIWDDVQREFPRGYPVTIDHRDANWWDVKVIGSKGHTNLTYLIRNGKAERQSA